MKDADIFEQLGTRGADVEKIAARVVRNPRIAVPLIGALRGKGTMKFAAEKVLRVVGERRPDVLYPHFDTFKELLDAENSIIRWGAIHMIANLAPADAEGKFEKAFRKYFAAVTGPDMIAAANIVGGAVKIARAKPKLIGRIIKELLKVESAEYRKKGQPSPECRNVVCGQVVEALDALYEGIRSRKAVLDFVKRQTGSGRPAVRRKAEAFLRKHAPSP